MNLILLQPSDRNADGQYVLGDHRAKHVLEVLQGELGKRVRVGLLDGPMGDATITRMESGTVTLDCTFDGEAPPRPRTDLVLAVPRPKSLRKLLPEVTALGIDRLVLLRTWRVGKPYFTSELVRPEGYRPLLHEGLMQARCTREPRVQLEPLFKPFIEDRAPALFADTEVRLMAHPGARHPLSSVKLTAMTKVVVSVGPEGGFVDYEIAAFEALGFRPVHMGTRRLRVETACVALLAQVALLREM